MSAQSTNIENRNFLSPLNFKFQIKRAAAVNFFIQKVNIPSITGISTSIPNPYVKYPVTYDHLNYGDLNITFKVDEELQNYFEMYNWLISLGKPESYQQFLEIESNPQYTGNGLYSDVSVIILNASQRSIFEVIYRDAFPTFISGFELNTTDDNVNYITTSSTLKYTDYVIKPIKD